MKQFYFTLLALTATALVNGANSDKTLQLTAIDGQSGDESYAFTYNENNLLVKEESNGRLQLINTFVYDENGNMVKDCCWQQHWETGEYVEAYYILYTYNENGQIISRRNFNSFGATNEEDFEMSADMVYSYNAQGQLSEVNTYWDAEHTDLYQTIVYDYDDNGQVSGWVESTADFFTGELALSCTTTCEYTPEGKIAHRYIVRENSFGSPIINNERFNYSEDGNLESFVLSGEYESDIVEYQEYVYGDKDASTIAFPITIEKNLRSELFKLMTKQPLQQTTVGRNADGELQLFDKFDFTYSDAPTAIGSIEANPDRGLMILDLRNGLLTLDGVNPGQQITIYSTAGNVVVSQAYEGPVSISHLAPGAYVVKAESGAAKFVTK